MQTDMDPGKGVNEGALKFYKSMLMPASACRRNTYTLALCWFGERDGEADPVLPPRGQSLVGESESSIREWTPHLFGGFADNSRGHCGETFCRWERPREDQREV